MACYIGRLSRTTFKLVSGREGAWVECEAFSRIPWLVHAFSTRDQGKQAALKPRRGAKANAMGNDGWRLVSDLGAGDFQRASLRQTHSSILYSVLPNLGSTTVRYNLSGYASAADKGKPHSPSGDALITKHAGILLGVRVADCLPVLLADRKNRAVAAVHAGWRGALGRVVEKTVGEMRRVFGSRPENLIAALGPSIRSCCYEVGEEVVDAFSGRFAGAEGFFRRSSPDSEAANRRLPLFFAQAPPGHGPEDHPGIYLDLVAVARYQLENAGVPAARIHVADYCTAFRTDLFYSYRKEGSFAGRMLAMIGVRPASSR